MLKISTSVGIEMKKPNAEVPSGGRFGISLGLAYTAATMELAPKPPRIPIIAETQ
jgi:hypothetical protein